MSNQSSSIIPTERIEHRILLIRDHKVLLDADLAALYGVSTKRLNEQVKRNQKRFPADFMFQLTDTEKQEVVANCDHLFRHLKLQIMMGSFILHSPALQNDAGSPG